jgi:hypothetical protein
LCLINIFQIQSCPLTYLLSPTLHAVLQRYSVLCTMRASQHHSQIIQLIRKKNRDMKHRKKNRNEKYMIIYIYYHIIHGALGSARTVTKRKILENASYKRQRLLDSSSFNRFWNYKKKENLKDRLGRKWRIDMVEDFEAILSILWIICQCNENQ